MALTYYRAQETEKCVDWINGSMEAHPNWEGHVWNWLLLALAHTALGQEDEARKWFTQAETWMQDRNPAHGKATDWLTDASKPLPEHAIGSPPLRVSHWLVALVLFREARTALK